MYKGFANGWLKHWDFILLDLICLELSYIASCVARHGWEGNPYHNPIYLNTGIVIILMGICAAFFLEGYTGIMRRGYFQEFRAVVKNIIFVSVGEVLYLFLSQNGEEFSRISFLVFVVCATALLYIVRVLWKTYLLQHKKVLYNKRSVLLVTTEARAEKVVRKAKDNTFNEIELLGVVLTDAKGKKGTYIEELPVVCEPEDVLDYIRSHWVDSVLINAGQFTYIPEDFIQICVKMGVTIHQRIADKDCGNKNQQIGNLAGYVVLSSSMKMTSARQLLLKRLVDICGGLVGVLLTAIFTIFLAPAIYLASPGPIFFSQNRVGQNGRVFKIYKFRSMYMDAEKRKQELMEKNQMEGFMFKMDEDPRIIGSGPDGKKKGLGWFIRKTSLDEFPQFLNVLKGDMSLVGTRPPTVDEWKQYDYHHKGRLAIKPGITGLWQVSGRSEITDFEEVVRLDTEYIQRWDVGLDIKILLKTVAVVLTGSGSK